MEWTEIWANYVLPAVASVGGFGAIFATIFTILKCKTNVVASARSAANNTLDGVKNGIQISINDIVEAKIRPVVSAALDVAEQMKQPVKAIAEEQAEIRKAILAFGEFLGASLSHGQDAKKTLKKAMDAIRQSGDATDGKIDEITKIVPKTTTVTLRKDIESKPIQKQPGVVR